MLMDIEFVYEIEDNSLIISKSPKIITRELLKDIEINSINNIYLCDDIEEIDSRTFLKLPELKSIRLSNNLKVIGEEAFCWCKRLKNISLPESLEVISNGCFCCCENLEEVVFKEGLKIIKSLAFSYCRNLKNVRLPDSLNLLGDGAFYMCNSLENVYISKNIKVLDKEVFCSCVSLKKVEMYDNIEKINKSCFEGCSNLSYINLSKNLTYIGEEAFYDCSNLKEIILPSKLEYLGASAFSCCKNLSYLSLGELITEINDKTFSRSGIEQIDLPFNLKYIGKEAFAFCSKLKNIVIPDAVKVIDERVFFCSNNIQEIHMPKKLESVHSAALDNSLYDGSNCMLVVDDAGKKIKIDCKKNKIIKNDKNLLFLYDEITKTYSFYYNGRCIRFNKDSIYNNKVVSKLIDHKYIKENDYIRVYFWLDKKFVPSHVVMKNMPFFDINSFFVNNNCLEWNKLIQLSKIDNDENKEAFFKLCYVLGVFSPSSSIRDKAVKFIKNNIIDNMSGEEIHDKFKDFELEKGYNDEYAEFFMKYYKSKNFMKYSNSYTVFDLTCTSYNNFSNVKKIYPNKTLNTNRAADVLLPEHVINAIKAVEYDNVDEGNEEFALLIGSYGYTQKQFEKLQKWFNVGKSIKENMRLFIDMDNEKEGITYKMLSKDDPIGAVLGNITNCCQIVSSDGESCVEYGMSEVNSSFITFNYKDKIIAEAWVWYDEDSKTICLDNIEVPNNYLQILEKNKEIQDNFIECLFRIEKNFKSSMKDKGFQVDKITIGQGHNDFKEILDKRFALTRKIDPLKGYSGFTDAYYQYEITRKMNNKKF